MKKLRLRNGQIGFYNQHTGQVIPARGGIGFLDAYGYGGSGYDSGGYDYGYDSGDYWGDSGFYDELPGAGLPFDVGLSEQPDIYSGGEDWWANFNAEGDYGVTPDFEPISTYEPYAQDTLPDLSSYDPGYVDVGIEIPDIEWAPFEDTSVPPPPLPRYCPGGTYHPIDAPYSCVPFPAAPTASQKQAQQKQAAKQAALQKAKEKAQQPCPSGQVRNPATGQCVPSACQPGLVRHPKTGQCVPMPNCPEGYLFNVQSLKCEQPSSGILDAIKGVPWWVWALIAGAAVVGGRDDSGRYRR
jgi:hypothetical protein